MTAEISVRQTIRAPARTVYDYVTDPRRLPEWAAGLASGIRQVDGRWVADSPTGPVTVRFADRNSAGIADHEVTLPDGTVAANRLRVHPRPGGCEVVFTLCPGADADAAARDVAAVTADLARLRRRLERPR